MAFLGDISYFHPEIVEAKAEGMQLLEDMVRRAILFSNRSLQKTQFAQILDLSSDEEKEVLPIVAGSYLLAKGRWIHTMSDGMARNLSNRYAICAANIDHSIMDHPERIRGHDPKTPPDFTNTTTLAKYLGERMVGIEERFCSYKDVAQEIVTIKDSLTRKKYRRSWKIPFTNTFFYINFGR